MEKIAAYAYTRLEATNIRLLGIESAPDSSPISCAIYHAQLLQPKPKLRQKITTALESKPKQKPVFYYALSYEWGDVGDAQQLIYLNNHTFMVGRNLWCALWHLRKRGFTSALPEPKNLIWINTICVNQDDLEERSQQIQHMRTIYSGAVEVFAWLGIDPQADPLKIPSNILNTSEQSQAVEGIKRLRKIEKEYKGPESFTENFPKEFWMDVKALLELSYWYRIWTVQEIVVAKHVVLLVGNHEADFDTLVVTRQAEYNGWARAQVLNGDCRGVRIYHIRKAPNVWYIIMPNLNSRMKHIPFPLSSPREEDVLFSGLPLAPIFQKEEKAANPFKVNQLLIYLADISSIDPRDKVYALLGLSTDPRMKPIKPDYSKSFFEVYADTMIFCEKYKHKHHPNQSHLAVSHAFQRHLTPEQIETLELGAAEYISQQKMSTGLFRRVGYVKHRSYSYDGEVYRVSSAKILDCVHNQSGTSFDAIELILMVKGIRSGANKSSEYSNDLFKDASGKHLSD
ncbi:hypothetical protein G7Y89_g12954 [Cudoniella acicularis]|uniref:Heterokaryon incompatibility domain-containing protein n=1 Tax=Cudoniella acicularis TaxID=354080 RepID=A0A8H4R895_9HELO|nr:hypothetical protein G7Y89_g12954 [Cudoniella acicularis]